MKQNKNLLKKFAALATRAVFVCPILLLFAPKTAFSYKIYKTSNHNLHIFK
jgi:hypothetical protein